MKTAHPAILSGGIMNRFHMVFVALALFAMACALPTPTSVVPTNTPAPSATPTIAATNTPATTATPQANAICNRLSFYLDSALASGFHCETLPEENSPDMPAFGVYPETTRITLDGYLLADRFHTPHIEIFAVQRFHEILPDAVDPRVAKLKGLIAGDPAGSGALPLLPVFNAAQMFAVQYAVVPFQNGSGIRYLAQYGQAYYPVNNHDLFLSYQGLTTDGKYWVSLILPISHPGFLENGDTQQGAEWDALMADAKSYFAQKTTELNALPPDSFVPAIPALDQLINSISIQP
jgi:hypothetical protein